MMLAARHMNHRSKRILFYLNNAQVKLANLADGVARLGYIGACLIALSFLVKQIVVDNNYSPAAMGAYLRNWQVRFAI